MAKKERIKKPLWKRWWFWIVVVVVVAGAAAGGSEESSSQTATTETSETSENGSTETAVETEEQPTVGDTVTVDDIEWTITNVETGSSFSSDMGSVETGSDETVLVKVSGKTVNRANEERSSGFSGLKLVDGSGTEYGEHEDAWLVADPLALDSFNPNVPKTFETIFEIPASAEEIHFKATNFAMFGEESILIDLGL